MIVSDIDASFIVGGDEYNRLALNFTFVCAFYLVVEVNVVTDGSTED